MRIISAQSDSAIGGRSRKGAIAVSSIFAIAAVACCVALAVNSVWIRRQRLDSKQASDAAALAAATRLLSDDILKSGLQPFEIDGLHLAAENAGIAAAERYRSARGENTLSGDDIRFDFTPPAFSVGTAAIIPSAVIVDRQARSNRLLFGGLTGVNHADLSSQSRAALRNRIRGFSAGPDTSVPLASWALPAGLSPGGWQDQIENVAGPDRLSWGSSGAESGGDGLPELTLVLPGSNQPASSGHTAAVSFRLAAALGLTADEGAQTHRLTPAGSDDSGPLPSGTVLFPVSTAVVAADARSIEQHVGEIRIFALYDDSSTDAVDPSEESDSGASASTSDETVSDGTAEIRLLRPVAARILAARQTSAGILITLQPAVISTSTAICTEDSTDGTSANPYVWNIALVN